MEFVGRGYKKWRINFDSLILYKVDIDIDRKSRDKIE